MVKTLSSKVKVLVIGQLEETRREKYNGLIEFYVSSVRKLSIALLGCSVLETILMV